MAFVLDVLACSTASGSKLRKPASTSTYTGVGPHKANTHAVETNVNDGMMISCPGDSTGTAGCLSLGGSVGTAGYQSPGGSP